MLSYAEFEQKREAADSAVQGFIVCLSPALLFSALVIVFSFIASTATSKTFFMGAAIPLVPMVFLVPHWLTAALLGRGDVAKLWVPNLLLGIFLSYLIFSYAVGFEFICAWQGVSSLRPENKFGFDGAGYASSPCDLLLQPYQSLLIVFLPIGLFLASTFARVLISRMKAKLT